MVQWLVERRKMLSEGAVDRTNYTIWLSLQLTGICSGSFDMMLWCLWKPVGRTLQAADVIEACLQSENVNFLNFC